MHVPANNNVLLINPNQVPKSLPPAIKESVVSSKKLIADTAEFLLCYSYS